MNDHVTNFQLSKIYDFQLFIGKTITKLTHIKCVERLYR